MSNNEACLSVKADHLVSSRRQNLDVAIVTLVTPQRGLGRTRSSARRWPCGPTGSTLWAVEIDAYQGRIAQHCPSNSPMQQQISINDDQSRVCGSSRCGRKCTKTRRAAEAVSPDDGGLGSGISQVLDHRLAPREERCHASQKRTSK